MCDDFSFVKSCPHFSECVNGCRYGKGCYDNPLNNAMGGKPWTECICGIDETGLLRGSRRYDDDTDEFVIV